MINVKNGNNPLFALGCLLQGVKMLTHPALRHYLLIPLLINTVLYTGLFILGYHTVSALIDQFMPHWLSWLNWLLWPLFFISFVVIGFFSFTLIANLIAAPFYSKLSAKTLELISQQAPTRAELTWRQTISGEWHRLGYLSKRTLPLLILFIIPGLNLFAPVLWGLFAAWGLAMEYMGYPLEDRGLAFTEQKQFMQQTRLGMLSFGGMVGLGLSLPLVNLLIGQAAVIGATIYIYRLEADRN